MLSSFGLPGLYQFSQQNYKKWTEIETEKETEGPRQKQRKRHRERSKACYSVNRESSREDSILKQKTKH